MKRGANSPGPLCVKVSRIYGAGAVNQKFASAFDGENLRKTSNPQGIGVTSRQ